MPRKIPNRLKWVLLSQFVNTLTGLQLRVRKQSHPFSLCAQSLTTVVSVGWDVVELESVDQPFRL